MNELSINWDYAKRESVLSWMQSYCKRNKIVCFAETEKYRDGSPRHVFKMVFKSSWQGQCFLNNAQKSFPYFEFI